MPLADLVNIQVSATQGGLTRDNFGTPLIACYHTVAGDLVRSFSSIRAAESAGFTEALQPLAWRMLARAFGQSRRPKRVKIGRRSAWVQIIRLTPGTPAAGDVYSGEIDGSAFSATADGTPTVAEICTALASAINALNLTPSDVTADGTSGTHVNITSASGVFHDYTEISANLTIKDVTSATSLEDDLTDFEAFDSDWYGLAFDVTNEDDIEAAAVWLETRRKIGVARTHDSLCADDGTTTDIASVLQDGEYIRTVLCYTREVGNFWDVGLLSHRMTVDPGSDTWAYKGSAGSNTDTLTDDEWDALVAKSCNFFVTIKGINVVLFGVTPSGEFVDVTRGTDWLVSRMQERVFYFLATNEKVPYDTGGISAIQGQVDLALQAGVDAKFLSDEPEPSSSVPELEDIDEADRAARVLNNVEWTARVRGAVHTVDIGGTLSF